jgi:hypothetical protein
MKRLEENYRFETTARGSRHGFDRPSKRRGQDLRVAAARSPNDCSGHPDDDDRDLLHGALPRIGGGQRLFLFADQEALTGDASSTTAA